MATAADQNLLTFGSPRLYRLEAWVPYYQGSYRSRNRDPKYRSIQELEQSIRVCQGWIGRWEAAISALTSIIPKMREVGAEIDSLNEEARGLEENRPGCLSSLFSAEARARISRYREIQGKVETLRRYAYDVIKREARWISFSGQLNERDMASSLVSMVGKEIEQLEALIAGEKAQCGLYASLLEEKKRIQAIRNAKEAKVASVDSRLREHAWMVKQQLERHPNCPYCGGPLGADPHADHIYPVAYGGLSTKENMVIICQDCNKRKGAMTLREFIQTYYLDRARIEDTLKRLGKKF